MTKITNHIFESWFDRRRRNLALNDRLHDSTIGDKGISDNDRGAIKDYTLSSTNLNLRLINGKKLLPHQEQTHETIKRLAKPIGEKVRLYSGTKIDFGELAKKSKDGILHSPAHLSSSHDLEKAAEFALGHPKHMIVIHAKPEDKGLHVSAIGAAPSEKETIIPAGTKLKYSHSKLRHTDLDGHGKKQYMFHHFTIHSQT